MIAFKRRAFFITALVFALVAIPLQKADAISASTEKGVSSSLDSENAAPAAAPVSALFQTEAFPSTGILDNFNRANGLIGSNWSGDTDDYSISANQLDAGVSEDIYWNASYQGVDQEVYVTLVNIDLNAAEIGLILKSQSNISYASGLIDVLYVPATHVVQVWTFAGTWNQHGTNIPVTLGNGDQFGARARANGDVEIYRNGNLLGTRSVSSWASHALGGYIGIYNMAASAAVFDDFGGGTPASSPTLTPTPFICTDPTTCNPVSSQPAFWRCDIPSCTDPQWSGAVVSWPSWSAYENNARSGSNSRTVYSTSGAKLYPYMGPWADGCQVTAVSGVVLIIEWQRGANTWRETLLDPGESHTIQLIAHENGAMLESPNSDPFAITLSNCNPQNIYGTSTPSATPSATLSSTPTYTAAVTLTPTATFTPSPTPTHTATLTFTPTNTATATNTATFTPTSTSTNTPTSTPSATPTRTASPTASQTATAASTATFTPTQTATATASLIPSATQTATGIPIPPTVFSIVRADGNPTSASSVSFIVTFSKPVTGVDAADFSLTTTVNSGATITNVTGSGATHTVTVNTGSGNGTIRLDLVDNDSIRDASNVPLGGSSNGSYTSGEVYIVAKNPTSLVNSLLPTSRSIQVGNTATVFNTVLNAGGETAYQVILAMPNPPAGVFGYQESDCATNQLLGPMNPALEIPAGQARCYVLYFTPSAPFASTEVHIQAQAANASATTLLLGVNTWSLRATSVAGPDIIALTTTTDFHQISCRGTKPFAVALSNVGSGSSQITVSADTGAAILPISLNIQETDPTTGVVIGDNVLQNVGPGENRTVVVWVTFNGCIGFDPAVNRIFVRFRDASNNLIGSTSTAISTNR